MEKGKKGEKEKAYGKEGGLSVVGGACTLCRVVKKREECAMQALDHTRLVCFENPPRLAFRKVHMMLEHLNLVSLGRRMK